MTISRRQALMTTLFGAGAMGLRALATGLPAGFLLDPRKALAAPKFLDLEVPKRQFVIFSTSGAGDPINTNCPGTYEDPKLYHSPDPSMAPTPITIQGKPFTAARPWSTLASVPGVLDRTVFFHLMTKTPVHPKERDVLQLMGASSPTEMLPSLLAKALAPTLNTIQSQPISLGGAQLTYSGEVQPIIPPLSLKGTLASPTGPLTQLQTIRDQTMSKLYDLYKNAATPPQQAYIDSMVTSQQQIRSISQNLLGALDNIKDNFIESQILAAITLIQMNVSPVVVISIPFGGDNHRDEGLAQEIAGTNSGCGNIVSLMKQLQAAGLEDRVSFMTLNVFGRTLAGNDNGISADTGRGHNAGHEVSVVIGKPFKGGVIGGCEPAKVDYAATGIDSATGAATDSGDVSPLETLGAFAQTMLAAVGADPSPVTEGKVIKGALAQ
jgi:hypothetical protein